MSLLLFPSCTSLLAIRVMCPILPILGGDLPSAGTVGCKHIGKNVALAINIYQKTIRRNHIQACNETGNDRKQKTSSSSNYKRTKVNHLAGINSQSKVLLSFKNLPNKITLTKKMFNKLMILAPQARYDNVFHMMM